MAQISITIPDAVLPRALDAMAGNYGYKGTLQDPAFPDDPTKTIPNPETKAQFAKRQIASFIKENVKAFEANTAAEAARATALASAESLQVS